MEVNRLTTLQLGCELNIKYHIVVCQVIFFNHGNRATGLFIGGLAGGLELNADTIVLAPDHSAATFQQFALVFHWNHQVK